MVLPPGRTGTIEVCVVSIFVIFVDSIDQTCIWMLTLYRCCFSDVGPWGREAEVIREPT
jgi:hypothetical protein